MLAQKLFVLSKRIHTFLVFSIVIFGFFMMSTGVVLKYATEFTALGVDVSQARWVHNQISTIFNFVFLLMMLTGLWMYIFPRVIKRSKVIPSDTIAS